MNDRRYNNTDPKAINKRLLQKTRSVPLTRGCVIINVKVYPEVLRLSLLIIRNVLFPHSPFVELDGMKDKLLPSLSCKFADSCDPATDPNCKDDCDVSIDEDLCYHTPDEEDELLERRAMCPFHYITIKDEDRYPKRLMEVRCCDTTCHDAAGGCRCEPVKSYVPVLMRTDELDENGMCRYDVKRYPLPTGCTAAVPYAPDD